MREKMEVKKLMALTELKNVIFEMKNVPNKINYTVDTTDERISELKS